MPALVIVTDEYAGLTEQTPDAMDGTNSIARWGRSRRDPANVVSQKYLCAQQAWRMPSPGLAPPMLAAGERDAPDGTGPQSGGAVARGTRARQYPTARATGRQGRLRWLNWTPGLCS